MKFTVFGGLGFIGSNLVQHLQQGGHEVFVPSRAAEEIAGQDLGHVVYAIGLTGDFRSRPFDTIDAHVGVLTKLLRRCRFESWLYLSSTRIYSFMDANTVASEDTSVPVLPNANTLYDLSKLLGEALCMAQASDKVRVARLSNVYGAGQSAATFLSLILRELQHQASVVINESQDSAKDYVALSYVLRVIEGIALRGRQRIYNVASGRSVTHAELASKLTQITGATVRFAENASRRVFPSIDVTRITAEFGAAQTSLLDELPELLATFKAYS